MDYPKSKNVATFIVKIEQEIAKLLPSIDPIPYTVISYLKIERAANQVAEKTHLTDEGETRTTVVLNKGYLTADR